MSEQVDRVSLNLGRCEHTQNLYAWSWPSPSLTKFSDNQTNVRPELHNRTQLSKQNLIRQRLHSHPPRTADSLCSIYILGLIHIGRVSRLGVSRGHISRWFWARVYVYDHLNGALQNTWVQQHNERKGSLNTSKSTAVFYRACVLSHEVAVRKILEHISKSWQGYVGWNEVQYSVLKVAAAKVAILTQGCRNHCWVNDKHGYKMDRSKKVEFY